VAVVVEVLDAATFRGRKMSVDQLLGEGENKNNRECTVVLVVAIFWQVPLHPLPSSVVFPSSHCSPPSMILLPHTEGHEGQITWEVMLPTLPSTPAATRAEVHMAGVVLEEVVFKAWAPDSVVADTLKSMTSPPRRSSETEEICTVSLSTDNTVAMAVFKPPM
jgi:hypothetical protein